MKIREKNASGCVRKRERETHTQQELAGEMR